MGFDPQQGEKLANRYQLEQELDSGAFGDAWLAIDTQTNQKTVAKVSHTRNYNTPVIEKHFEREWEALNAISNAGDHPNIMSIIDYGTDGAYWYSVVEYIDGEEVHNYIQNQGTITDTDTIRKIGTDLCDAMAFLHENEIVYRDLKPDNVIFESGRDPTIIDFNTARQMEPGTNFATSFRGPFKAPEISGFSGETGPWTDVYSIGKFLFYLMTEDAQKGDELNPQDFAIQVDPYLANIVEQATNDDHQDRYRNATVLKRALENQDPAPPEQLELLYLQEDRRITVSPGDTIGRDGGQAAIRVKDDVNEYLSSVHAKFDTQGSGQWVISDSSTNGTWISKSHENDFEHRLLSSSGKQRLQQAGKAPSNVDQLPEHMKLDDGDVIGFVNPDYQMWFKVNPKN